MADSPRIAENRKARQYYEFLEFFEAGISLTGPEVKSLRAGQVSFGDSFVESSDGEAWLVGMRIAPYDKAGYARQDPDRRRRLLLHAREIHLITTKVEQKGLTVVPAKSRWRSPLPVAASSMISARNSSAGPRPAIPSGNWRGAEAGSGRPFRFPASGGTRGGRIHPCPARLRLVKPRCLRRLDGCRSSGSAPRDIWP